MKTFTLFAGRLCWGDTHLALLRRGTYAMLLSFLLLLAAAGAAAAAPDHPGRAWASGMEPAGRFTYLTGTRWMAVAMAPLLVNISHTDVTCAGNDGTAAAAVTGGVAPYTYGWSNGATTATLTGLSAGNYSVVVTDATGSTATCSSGNIQVFTPITATPTIVGVQCSGDATGSISLSELTGGVAPYTYLWSNGSTASSIKSLTAGTYTVVITDHNGCTSTTSATVPATVNLLATTTRNDASCAGSTTGSIMLAVSGGTTPYSYRWSNGATTQDLSGLTAGIYSVTVTDAGGCTGTAAATIREPAALRLSLGTPRPSCFGGASGGVSAAVSGGTTPYSYLWSNGATTASLSGVGSGAYTVTVTDANGCVATGSATITESTQITALTNKTNATCYAANDGIVTLAVGGSAAPLTYLWSTGATTQNLSGVAAGLYSVTVTDANGCTATASASVGAPTQLRVLATATAASCTGSATGSVALTVNGGTAPFAYLWSNGATTQNLTSVAPGFYSVTVTDTNGCTAGCSATVGGATALRPSITVTAATCCASSSGRVDLTVSGGTAPYSYQWSNGATTQNLGSVAAGTYTVIITDASGCTATASGTVTQPAALALRTTLTNPSCCNASTGGIGLAVSGGTAPYTYQWSNGATTQNLSGIPAGIYSVTVTDAHGCTASTSATIVQPTALRANTSSTNATCAGSDGTATATVSGGTAPYSYSWSPGGQTSATATGLGAGSYTVTLTDARGYTATNSTSLLAASCQAQHCTLTQGGYGNSNGVICKEPSKRRLELIADMFITSNLVLGAPGRSLIYSYTGGIGSAASLARQATAQCIIDKLPAGGSAAAFPGTLGNASGCASSFPAGFLRNGRFSNVFVGQTLTLALNLRLDNTLAGVPLSATITSYATINCSLPNPSDLTGISRSMPAAVLGNLSYAGGTPTVGSLLALANKALGGVAYANGGGNPSISDVNGAVGGINELFDECRILNASPALAFSARTTNVGMTIINSSASATNLRMATEDAPTDTSELAAFPNPFTAATALKFTLPETTKYALTVYDLKGSEVARVSSGEAQAGVRYSFAMGAGLQEGVYVARLVTTTGTQTIRLNLLH